MATDGWTNLELEDCHMAVSIWIEFKWQKECNLVETRVQNRFLSGPLEIGECVK